MLEIKPKYKTVTKTIRMPEPVTRELERLAEKNNMSFAAVVTQCVQYALEHLLSDKGDNE